MTETLLDKVITFYENYYADDIARLAQSYPRDSRSLEIDWNDLYQAEPAFAEDVLENPLGKNTTERAPLQVLHDGLYEFDLAADVSFESENWPDAHVRITVPENKKLGVGELRSRLKNRYVGIYGQIERVTQQTERLKKACWECSHCPEKYYLIQPRERVDKPNSCAGNGCKSKTFYLNEDESELVDLRKLKLKQPPEDASGDGKSLKVYLEDDAAFLDGEQSLTDMAGERATIHGILKRDTSNLDGRSPTPEFGSYLEGHTVEFENTVAKDVATEEYTEEIKALVNREDTLQHAIRNFAPGVAGGKRIQQIKRACILYLFGSYRKERTGQSHRGDIHILLVGDPATGKTTIMDFIEEVSPRCERLSGTDATGVGLTAAATQDEFANGDWVLKPGLLPRASGGHAIVDEIDKMDGGENLHEALESQRIHVAKAGMKATLKTEVGLIAAGNPKNGRFEGWDSFIDEIDIDPALFSRFDVIHTLVDNQDQEKDEAVASAMLDSWSDVESEESELTIPMDVWTAWIATAQEYNPTLSEDAKSVLMEFYQNERDEWDGEEGPPLTARALPTTARLAEAHARMNLRETVTETDAEIAVTVKKAMIGDVQMDDDMTPNADILTGKSQKQRRNGIVEAVREYDGDMPLATLQDSIGLSEAELREDIDKLKQKGRIIEPTTNEFRAT